MIICFETSLELVEKLSSLNPPASTSHEIKGKYYNVTVKSYIKPCTYASLAESQARAFLGAYVR